MTTATGIDLGTTFSLAAALQGGNAVVLPNVALESQDEPATASHRDRLALLVNQLRR